MLRTHFRMAPPHPPPSQGSSLRHWVQLHLVVLAWGCTGVLGKLISLPAVEVVIWRTGMASFGLAILARALGASLRVSGPTALRLLGSGLLVGLHWMLFFLSVQIGNVSMCMAALPTTMLWCTLLEPLLLPGHRLQKNELAVGSVMIGAVWLIYHVEFSHWLGFTAGLGAALVGALFAVINKRLVSRLHFAVISCYQMAGACMAGFLAWPFFAHLSGLSWQAPQGWDFFYLLILSLVCTVGAYAGYLDVLRHMSIFVINVAYNLEPVYGIVLAALLFGDTERMSAGFYAGATVIMGTVLVLPWLSRALSRSRKPSPAGA